MTFEFGQISTKYLQSPPLTTKVQLALQSCQNEIYKPAGISINIEHIQNDLDRRRPGQSEFTTARSEADKVEILSGLHFDKDDNGCQLTLGSPIGFIIRNLDKKSSDYDALNDIYRPSHADYTYQSKYGIRDHRGGGRSSARETVCRVVGGAIAKQLLGKEVVIQAYVEKMGGVAIPQNAEYDICYGSELDLNGDGVFQLVELNGDLNGGNYYVTLLKMSTSW